MSSRAEERGRFIERLRAEGVPEHVTRLVMRHAATLQRLAEAQCNGDYPADNGERKVKACCKCEGLWAPESLMERAIDKRNPHPTSAEHAACRICKDCRTAELVTEALAPYNVTPVFQGDPRGAVVKLRVPSGKTDDWGQTGLCVP